MKKLIIFLLLAAVVTACNNKKPEAVPTEGETTEANTDSAKLAQSYDSLVVTEARAAVDSTYVQSDEYKASHEAYDKMIARMTNGMEGADAALYQLEMAAASLQHNGSYFASNTELMRDPVNQQRMRITVQKAQELGKSIQNMGLTPDQQVLFDSLKAIIHI